MVLSPWFIFGGKVTGDDIRAAQKGALPPGVTLQNVGEFLIGLHKGGTNVLGVLHSLGYTRGLLNDIAFPERLRLRAYVKHATVGMCVRHADGASDVDVLRLTRSMWWCAPVTVHWSHRSLTHHSVHIVV